MNYFIYFRNFCVIDLQHSTTAAHAVHAFLTVITKAHIFLRKI